MGYGGGAMVGVPLAVWLMSNFSENGVPGVSKALIAMGAIYFVVMFAGALGFRVAPSGWRPAGWQRPTALTSNAHGYPTTCPSAHSLAHSPILVDLGVLFLNVTAGIAVISMASPMLQDVFGAKLLGVGSTAALTTAQRSAIAAAAAGLVGLISLFNSVGRIFWTSLSDKLGRKNTYYTFLSLALSSIVYHRPGVMSAFPRCSLRRSASS